MKKENKPIPFWSWNDKLEKEELERQIEWMDQNGIGGFFMHARAGLKTEYLSKEWFDCVRVCCRKAEELGMDAWAYDENGWPSGFVGGELLKDKENLARYLTYGVGVYDETAFVSYALDGDELTVTEQGENCLNVYLHLSVSNTDILNPDVVDKFIEATHEKYKKEVLDRGYKLKGFFTDEPQYYRGATPYTPVIEEYFLKKYGEGAKNKLGLLFVEKEGHKEFRYRYWLGLNTLLTQNYARKLYEWCDRNGLQLTGHYIEERSLFEQMICCAGCSPLYEYEHIPAIDWLRRDVLDEIAPKQVGSVAAQLGKKLVLTETFAACGWSVMPRELKRIAEYQYVHGVNLLCGHLTPYSEYGQRKRDYPAHFSDMNPWCKKYFKDFNDYFSALGERLSESKEVVDVGVLHPMRSIYFVFKRNDFHDSLPLNNAFSQQMELLGDKQIPHHYLDETLLEKYGSITEDGRIRLGECCYKYLILPTMYTMGKFTEKLLKEFVDKGGKVLLLGEKPTYLEGQPFDYPYLHSNVSLEQIIELQSVQIFYQGGKLRTSIREKNGERFVYAVNLSETEDSLVFVNGKKTLLKAYESKIILPNLETGLTIKKKTLDFGTCFQVVQSDKNKLTIDRASYSFDNQNYSEEYSVRQIFKKLLIDRYEGILYLKYRFKTQIIPEDLQVYIENMNTQKVWLNGKQIYQSGHVLHEKELYAYNISSRCKQGENEIVIRLWYYQNKDVYYALFGENVTESLRNCLVYDTNIESIYLEGAFGVYGEFSKGETPGFYIGKNFYLDKCTKEVSNLICDGYPFFAGEIVLEREVELSDTNYELVVDGRFHGIGVYVNEKFAGILLFENSLDISQYLCLGKNKLRFEVMISNRNLLGPHHMKAETDNSIAPRIFDAEGDIPLSMECEDLTTYKFVQDII